MSYSKAETMMPGILLCVAWKVGRGGAGRTGRRGTIVTPRTNWIVTARPLQLADPGWLQCAFTQIDCSGHVVLLWSVYVPEVRLSAMGLVGSGWCGLELHWHVFDSTAGRDTFLFTVTFRT
jgi:hypothetical protein